MIDPWHHFSADWSDRASGSNGPGIQLGRYQQQAIVAMLKVQQEAATRMKTKGPIQDCRQFSSDIRTQSWLEHVNAISMPFSERAEGFDYEYQSYSRTCFRGSFVDVWDLDQPNITTCGKQRIERELVAFKLQQFKEVFPDVTHLWIFLNALATAHFYRHVCPRHDKDFRSTAPELKLYKVQFDQDAILTATSRYSEAMALEYTVHQMPIGNYCPYQLVLHAPDDLVLMNVSLGIQHRVISSLEAAEHQASEMNGTVSAAEIDFLIE